MHGAGEAALDVLALEDRPRQRQRDRRAGLVGGVQPLRPAAADGPQLVQGDGGLQPLQLDVDRRRRLGETAELLERLGGEQHLAADRAALHARGEVHGGADHGVLRALLGADVADDCLAGMQANAHLEARPAARDVLRVECLHRALHGQGAGRRALSVVDVLDRRAVDREDRVADELVDGAAVRDHDVGHAAEVIVQHRHDAGGIAVLGEAGVAAQVGHQHGDPALLAAQAQAVR
jgi:hypothetical protein